MLLTVRVHAGGILIHVLVSHTRQVGLAGQAIHERALSGTASWACGAIHERALSGMGR
jgi:hypothetical protein